MAFEELSAEIQLTYEAASTNEVLNLMSAPFVGMAVAACFSQDKRWYRAEIFEIISEEQVNVFFVDYGNKEIFDVKHLKILLPDFMKYEIQVYEFLFLYLPFMSWKFTILNYLFY